MRLIQIPTFFHGLNMNHNQDTTLRTFKPQLFPPQLNSFTWSLKSRRKSSLLKGSMVKLTICYHTLAGSLGCCFIVFSLLCPPIMNIDMSWVWVRYFSTMITMEINLNLTIWAFGPMLSILSTIGLSFSDWKWQVGLKWSK